MSELSKFQNIDQESNNYYYLYYYRTNRIREVKIRVFNNTQGPVFSKFNKRIRVIDCNSRTKAYSKIKGLLSREFKPQSIFGDFHDTFIGFKMLVHIVKNLGAIKKNIKGREKVLIVSLIKLVMEVYSLMSGQFNVTNFIQVILSIYSLHKTVFEAQSLDVILLAGMAAILPQKLVGILRSAQLLSSMKMGDDLSLINKMVAAIFNLCEYLMAKVPITSKFKPMLDKIFGFFKNNTAHVWITQMENALNEVQKNPSKLGNQSYRLQIEEINKKYSDNPEIADWSRRSAALGAIITRWKNLMRTVASYGQPDRQEPNCFVFEGPPGCMKSVLMSAVIKASGLTCYSHLVKSTTDGKDWYDSYNSEDIFFMDDVGQQSVSQWRTIINMVSCVKLPLDCAEATLKDTKFFNSPTIMVTTNAFQHLQGLTKQDCISDIKALWRRGYVFDFSKVTRVGDFIKGEISFKYFDIGTQRFESSFPNNFATAYPNIPSNFVIDPKVNTHRLDVISWMLCIVNGFSLIKKSFVDGNKLSTEDVDYIKEKSKLYLGQGKPEVYDEAEQKEFEESELQRALSASQDDYQQATSIMREFRTSHEPVTSQRFLYNKQNEKIARIVDDEPFGITIESQGSGFSRCSKTTKKAEFEKAMSDIDNIFDGTDEPEVETKEEIKVSSFWTSAKWFAGVVTSYVQELLEKLFETMGFKDNIHIYLFSMCFIVVLGLIAGGAAYGIHKLKSRNLKSAFVDKYGVDKLEQVLKNFETQGWREDFKYPDNKVSTNTVAVQRAVKEIDLVFDGSKIKGFGLVSGRHILVPRHFIGGKEGVITIYSDRDKNSILVDNESFTEEWGYDTDDISVLALARSFPSPFPNLCHFFQSSHGSMGKNCLVNAFGIKFINDDESNQLDRAYSYVHKLNQNTFVNKISQKDFTYFTQGAGMCGSVIVNAGSGVLGMHVAGDVAGNTGVAIKWSEAVRGQLFELLQSDKNIIPWTISPKITPNTSVVKLDRKMYGTVPSYTNMGPSPLYGVYPTTRTPANMQKFGRFTVKDIAKKSFAPVANVPLSEVKFGEDVIESFIEPYFPITESEIVKGNDMLAGLNKKSSNGFDCSKDKEDYVDFENGVLTEKCRKEIREIEESIINGKPKWDAFVWVESLKDELRNDEKEGTPRSFRVGTIHQQVLMKKYFGGMVGDLIKSRDFHQIMVGMNPLKEWPKMYEKLQSCAGVFACDVEKYDGRMLSQVQRACAKIVASKCQRPSDSPYTLAEHNTIVEFLIETLVHSLVAVMDDFYLTTHSMPSGSFLTAIFNSIVNKFYTAMWYNRYCKLNGVKPTVKDFWNSVIDYVYGDDKLNGIKKYPHFLNAETMRDFFVSIGMNLTASDKSIIDKPFEDINDVTFLKRSFRYHNKLERIVCPLDLRTLYSGLSFVDHSKDIDIVMDGKVGCFQREIYLHTDRDALIKDFKVRLDNFPLSKHQIYTETYLLSIYKDPDCQLDSYADIYV